MPANSPRRCGFRLPSPRGVGIGDDGIGSDEVFWQSLARLIEEVKQLGLIDHDGCGQRDCARGLNEVLDLIEGGDHGGRTVDGFLVPLVLRLVVGRVSHGCLLRSTGHDSVSIVGQKSLNRWRDIPRNILFESE